MLKYERANYSEELKAQLETIKNNKQVMSYTDYYGFFHIVNVQKNCVADSKMCNDKTVTMCQVTNSFATKEEADKAAVEYLQKEIEDAKVLR